MPEVPAHDPVDKVSCFLGAIVDHLCGTSDNAMIALVSTFYVDFDISIYKLCDTPI